MNFCIRDLARSEEWVVRLGAVLHDAWIDEEYRWSETTKCFEVLIERIAYEAPQRDWRFLKSYPRVRARLTVFPVCSLEVDRDESAVAEEWGDQLLMISFHRVEPALVLGREWGTTTLLLEDGASLTVVDTGAPAAHAGAIDVGSPLDLESALEVIGTSEV